MMKQLTLEEAIVQNQEMIDKWKAECKMDGHLAFYMAVIDKDMNLKVFHSEGMSCDAFIRNLKAVIHHFEQNPY